MKARVDHRELTALLSRVKGLSQDRMEKEVNQRLKITAGKIVDDAQGAIPVISGRARDSIKMKVVGGKPVIEAGDSNKVKYFPWLEFGGSIKPPGRRYIKRPYLRGGRYLFPALKNRLREMVRDAEDAVKGELGRAGLK